MKKVIPKKYPTIKPADADFSIDFWMSAEPTGFIAQQFCKKTALIQKYSCFLATPGFPSSSRTEKI